MRWEEIWDLSLRIRNHFSRTKMTPELLQAIRPELQRCFGSEAVAVRSSSLQEDSASHSFAGLHESYLNIAGAGNILEYVKKVWASLWSDAAMLYRKELDLDISSSAMAVVVQEFIPGDVSGIAFGRNPLNEEQLVIEAVAGLNDALVDGKTEPDRWILARESMETVSVRRAPGREREANELLSPGQIGEITAALAKAEHLFGSPQDVEWTYIAGELYLLQARPITAGGSAAGETQQVRGSDVRDGKAADKRSWYLSLRPGYEKLAALRRRIEDELIPEMVQEGEALAADNLSDRSDDELAGEIHRRKQVLDRWQDVYWEDFIPFAHGVRFFGKIYNDRLNPEDPFEFVDLLRPREMESLGRDDVLRQMAAFLQKDQKLREEAEAGNIDFAEHPELTELLAELRRRSGNMLSFATQEGDLHQLGQLMLMMADKPLQRRAESPAVPEMVERYLCSFPEEDRDYARDILALGRSSYRLRDDDNLYLGLIEEEYWRAVKEGNRRGKISGSLRSCLGAVHYPEEKSQNTVVPGERDRQLVGQPAGAGLATARARVILHNEDLFTMQQGEILVCDALDPNMTFIISLSAGIVERRGGMLIHGAIIAREYGLPCVTGISNVTDIIKTGDRITVDGYLGIVVLSERHPSYSE